MNLINEELCCNVNCSAVLSVPLSRCSKCRLMCYCSRFCQKEAWKAGHNRECGQPTALSTVQVHFTDFQIQLYNKMKEFYDTRNDAGIVALETPARIVADQMRNPKPEFASTIYRMLGFASRQLGQYAKAIELSERGLSITVESGNRGAEGRACGNLGSCYAVCGKIKKGIEMHMKSLAIAEELGNRADQGTTLCNLGSCYVELGQYGKAIELYKQCQTIEEELGDIAGLGSTISNLGICYESLQQYDKAIELLENARVIHQKVHISPALTSTLSALGRCKRALGEYAQAIICHTEQWEIAHKLNLVHDETGAAHNVGVVMWAQARVNYRDAAAAGMTLSVAYMDSMRDAEQWLRTALRLALTYGFRSEKEKTLLHLSFFAYDTGNEEEALNLLIKYMKSQVDHARSFCNGCGQERDNDAHMLTCGGCGVARFCNEHCQRMGSVKSHREHPIRHKDICSLLMEWRKVARGNATAESLTPNLLEFLRRDVWWKSHKPISQ